MCGIFEVFDGDARTRTATPRRRLHGREEWRCAEIVAATIAKRSEDSRRRLMMPGVLAFSKELGGQTAMDGRERRFSDGVRRGERSDASPRFSRRPW